MLLGITYNSNPESLDAVAVAATDFVAAFESEVRAQPLYRDLRIAVTFNAGKSEVSGVLSDRGDENDYADDDSALQDEFKLYAERAFSACLR